jgi:hypothetical protein
VNVSEFDPSALRTEMSKFDSHVWRTMMDAASKVQHYYVAKVERNAPHGASPRAPLTGQDASESVI